MVPVWPQIGHAIILRQNFESQIDLHIQVLKMFIVTRQAEKLKDRGGRRLLHIQIRPPRNAIFSIGS